jgi:hypothetical protein
VLGSGSAEPSSTRRARGLVNPIVLTHSTGRGSKGEALLVYSAWDCYGRSAADLHAMLPSLCVVIVRVFCSTFLIVCVPFQLIDSGHRHKPVHNNTEVRERGMKICGTLPMTTTCTIPMVNYCGIRMRRHTVHRTFYTNSI